MPDRSFQEPPLPQDLATPRGLIADRHGPHHVAFLGRPLLPRDRKPVEALAELALPGSAPPRTVRWNRQVHSNRVRTVSLGSTIGERAGAENAATEQEADALYTTASGLALAVFTADCVPVLIAGGLESAAVHAGWRGLEAKVIGRALEHFEQPRRRLVAWIGPAMSSCCYEVNHDVAVRVAAVSGPDVIDAARQQKPHLDLAGAARNQLLEGGVEDLRLFHRCTGCAADEWWSYRRGAVRGERNLAVIWRQG